MIIRLWLLPYLSCQVDLIIDWFTEAREQVDG